jgi:hypothetical protein
MPRRLGNTLGDPPTGAVPHVIVPTIEATDAAAPLGVVLVLLAEIVTEIMDAVMIATEIMGAAEEGAGRGPAAEEEAAGEPGDSIEIVSECRAQHVVCD